MKKYLPRLNNSKAFTLIELLVVIAIIAIISVISVALFSNVQVQARNGKRLAELEQIANALEITKTANGYQPLVNTQFNASAYPGGGGLVAVDPSTFAYCISNAGSATANPAAWNSATCPASYTQIGNVAALPTANSLNYKICTIQEGLSGGAATVTCRVNLQ